MGRNYMEFMKNITIILLFLVLKFQGFAQISESFKDQRDGKIYKTIKINAQVWMAENLNYATDSLSYCYNNDPENCEKYGRLYLWEIANNICPKGWHLPSDEEWKTLEKSLGMPDDTANAIGFRGADYNIGGKLKSLSGWKYPNNGATNVLGFNALPGGCYGSHEKDFFLLGTNSIFWTSSANGNEFAWHRDLDHFKNDIFRNYRSKKIGFSVRCVKNE